jgi:hypothetical protein
MYRNGTVLSLEEIRNGSSHTGNLIIEEYARTGRLMLRARLLETMTKLARRDIVPPLFEAELVTMDDQQMVLRGYNYFFDISILKEQRYCQSWLMQHPPTWTGYRG